MAYKTNFDLSVFETEVRKSFRDGFERKDYQEAVGRISRRIRDTLMDGKNSPARELGFPEWFEPVRKYLGDYSETTFEKATSFQSAIDTMCNRDTDSMHFALPIHYRLHMPEEPNNTLLRDKLDRFVFDGETFEEAFGRPVFELDPDVYDEPAPMAAPMRHPGYITAKEAHDALERDADDSIWLNPHNHYTLPLQEREGEKARLTRFVTSEAMFRVLPVIAPSGAGKTRLVSEWMRDYSAKTNPESVWEAGFLSSDQNDQARNPDPWKVWEIKKHTLIVIDYTYAFDEVVKAITERAIHRAEGREFKVRLIVIDHVMPQVLHDDFLWGGVASGKRQTDHFNAAYLEPELRLTAAGDKSEMLSQIIESSARVGLPDGTDISQQVKEAMDHLDRMGNEQGDRDSVRHPLFAALMGRALRNATGKVDFSTWKRRDLVEQYFTGKDRLPWTAATDATSDTERRRVDLGLNAGAWVSAATLRRGLSRISAKPYLSENFETTFQIAQRVTSTTNTFEIGPFLPDILGETFVLKFLEATADEPNSFATFVDLVNTDATDPVDVARNFRETVVRLARNLAGEDPALTESQTAWDQIIRLLDPRLYPVDSLLRTYVSFTISDIMKVLGDLVSHQKLSDNCEGLEDHYACLVSRFSSKAEPKRLFRKIATEEVASWALTCFWFFELSDARGRDEVQNLLLDAARLCANHENQNITVTMQAAAHGCLNVIRVLSANLGENADAQNSDGWTAVMFASLCGQLDIIRYLHAEAGCNLDAITDGGCTAAIVASQNGHLDILRYLHAEAGCNLDAIADDGTTAAIVASQNGHLDILRYLHAEAGCNLDAITDGGYTAAMFASYLGDLDILRYLISQHTDLRTRARHCCMPLMVACMIGNLEVVKLLVDCGADISAMMPVPGIDGVSALMVARASNHLAVADFLVSKGASPYTAIKTGRSAQPLAEG